MFSRSATCALPLLLLFAQTAHPQDELTVVSPDGQLQFRLATAMPEGSTMNSLAYQVWLRGKPLIDTSYLGLNIHFQEPLLGENVGLSSAKKLHGDHYNGIFADYPQTSTTGRRIQIEARVWNDGVAFRYIVPQSPLLLDLLIQDEETQFHFANPAINGRPAKTTLPYVEQESNGEWIGIYEQPMPGFPPLQLLRSAPTLMHTHLPDQPNDPLVAFETKTPWTGPWRMIAIAPNRERLAQSEMLRDTGN